MNMTVLRENAHRANGNLPHLGITRLILTAPVIAAVREHASTYWGKHTKDGEDTLLEHLRDVLTSMPGDDILDLHYVYQQGNAWQLAKVFMEKMTSMGELKKQIDAVCEGTLEQLGLFYEKF